MKEKTKIIRVGEKNHALIKLYSKNLFLSEIDFVNMVFEYFFGSIEFKKNFINKRKQMFDEALNIKEKGETV